MTLSNAARQRIINLTKVKKMSLKELSRRSKVSYSTLMGFMSGSNKTINIKTLYKLCLGMKVELVDFFDDNLFKDVIDENEKATKTLQI